MVGGLGVLPFVASIVSSSTAALTVFLMSRHMGPRAMAPGT